MIHFQPVVVTLDICASGAAHSTDIIMDIIFTHKCIYGSMSAFKLIMCKYLLFTAMRLVCYGFADLFIFFDWPFAIWHFERVPPVGVQSSGFKTKIAQHISDARAKVKFRLQQSLCCVITLAVTRCVGWVWGVSRVWGGGPSHGSQKKKKQTADVIGWLSGRV